MKKNLSQNNRSLNNLLSRILVAIQFLVLLNPLPAFAEQDSTSSDPSHWPTLLVLGDSISAAFGIEQSKGWVALLAQKLQSHQYRMHVVNASISGETTQGGLQRLPALLEKYKPVIVIVELGGNDGLRGLKLSMIKSNLRSIIEHIKAKNAHILLAGIRLPPNYGQAYTEKFYQIFLDLAKQEKVPLVPFLMDGVAKDSSLMQADGIHPTADAQPVMLKNVWFELQAMVTPYLARAANN